MKNDPLRKANLRLLCIMIAAVLAMTAYWLYFIIAKEPIQP
ncbi:MAG: hypothetical protein ACO3E8_02780 [Candidatus Methylacidiphilales bacterium]|jgi:hypothetical protein